MRRALFPALVATLAFACSLTNLDGFSTGGPDAGSAPLPDATSPTGDATLLPPDAASADAETESGTIADPYGDAVRLDNPAAWYRFEEAPGAMTVKDTIGLHPATPTLDGNPKNEVTFGVAGVVGKAAKLKTDGDGISVGDVFDFNDKTEHTLESWGENDAPEQEFESILNKRLDTDQGAQNGWIIFLQKSDRTISYQFWKNGTSNAFAGSTTAIPAGFHHYVVTVTRNGDGVDCAMYVDGERLPGGTKGNTILQNNTTTPLRIARHWSGRVDEVAIYERPLTADRIKAHYQAAPR